MARGGHRAGLAAPAMRFILFVIHWALVGLGVAALLVILWSALSGGLANWSGPRVELPRRGYATAVARAAPAVVSVRTLSRRAAGGNALTEDPLFRRFFDDGAAMVRRETSLGSGVLLDASGVIVTNYHVIADADSIHVSLRDGRQADARIVGTDPETDLAVLKIELDDLPMVVLGDSDALRVGDIVLAMGYPLGIGQTVTQGIVSATGRNRVGINTFESFIQTDAAINFGNSGGALVDSRGALVGINATRIDSEGIGFAIPTALALDVARQILEQGSVQRGWLGLDARDLNDAQRAESGIGAGILVLGVLAEGPADRAGVLPGDVITHIGDEPIGDSRTAIDRITSLTPGSRVAVTLLRAGRAVATEAVVSRRPLPR